MVLLKRIGFLVPWAEFLFASATEREAFAKRNVALGTGS